MESRFQWLSNPPDFNSIQQLWNVVKQKIHIMNKQLKNLQHLSDAMMSIWTKTAAECLKQFVESVSQRIKMGSSLNKMYLIKWLMSVLN